MVMVYAHVRYKRVMCVTGRVCTDLPLVCMVMRLNRMRRRAFVCAALCVTLSCMCVCVICVCVCERESVCVCVRVSPQEEARKAIEAINAVMSHLGAAAVDLLTDQNKMIMAVSTHTHTHTHTHTSEYIHTLTSTHKHSMQKTRG